MRTVAVVLALVASACAYTVTQPNASNGWTNSGPQTLTWDRVSTDATNFTVVLTNQNRAAFAQDQVLIAEQDGVGQTQAPCNPPSGGWPVGPNFRVNLVKSVNDQSTIYAQSSEFTIKAASSSSSALSTSRPAGTVQVPPPVTTNTSPDSSGTTNPPGSNSAAVIKASTGLMAILGAVTYLVV